MKDLAPQWEFVGDTVMGGVSVGRVSAERIADRDATRLTGHVSLENNGGFVQMAFDINPGGMPFDASGYAGVAIDVLGNGETYDLRLRTSDLERPWQSYRASFVAPASWTTVRVPFTECVAHKTDTPFDARRIRRIGVLAIGRVFEANVAVASVGFIAHGPGQ